MPEPFRPWFWLRNPHLQTVLGVYGKGSAFPHATVRRRVRLPDGDQIVLHDTVPPASDVQRTAALYFVGDTPAGPRLYREFQKMLIDQANYIHLIQPILRVATTKAITGYQLTAAGWQFEMERVQPM